MTYRLLERTFLLLLSLIYGVMAAGQFLGFTNLYYPWLVLSLSLILAGIAFLLYRRFNRDFQFIQTKETAVPHSRWLDGAFLASGLAVFFLLIFYPLLHWPSSPITMELPWDAGLYHFPKAIEMIVTHSSWDLSIAYGEYPFGYETLIAAAFLINRAGLLVGVVHALIALFLLLAMWLLTARRTRVPAALIMMLVVFLLVSKQMFPLLSNPWWMFWPQVTLIGKNDALLAAAILAVLAFTPFSKKSSFAPLGLAVASMVAISIKPNAAIVLLFAWFAMLFFLWRAKQLRSMVKQLLWSAVLMAPGGLWMVRNLIVQGSLFSADSLRISAWSISSNLTNPYFYNHIPRLLYLVLGVIAVSLLVSIFRRSLRFDVLAALVLLVSFAITPATAFFGSSEVPTQVAWRFSLALMAYLLILLLALFDPLILPVYRWIARRKLFAVPAALLVAALGVWALWDQRDLLESFPENGIVLQDQYRASVGVDGYYSAYDYVQQNVHDSVVIIENGLPYYLYDKALTNSVTRSRSADYIVYLQTPWINDGGYPDELSLPAWSQTWGLIYEDAEGRVYQRK